MSLVLSGEVSAAFQQPLLSLFATGLSDLSNDNVIELVPPLLSEIANRIITLEEQVLGKYHNFINKFRICKLEFN
jgi:hypothetical protein